MRSPAPWIKLLALLAVVRAQAAPAPTATPPATTGTAAHALAAAKKPAEIQWDFSLIPKAFDSNPPLDMTVITEMTDFGKKQPAVSPQSPAYYSAQSSGYHTTGDGHPGSPLPADKVEAILQHSLAANGYLPSTPAHPPTIAIFYFWGAHMLYDQDNPALSDEQWTKNILERAALAGGEKFAAQLDHAITESDAFSASNSSRLSGGGDSMGNLGAAAGVAQMSAMMNPIRLFTQYSFKNQFLVDQASSDCYYVVASAYDYSSVATHVKRLLWRTRMTVNAQGVSQIQSLPTLIATAAPYFGVDMAEAETMTKRAVADGKVEIGTATVVEPTAAAGKKKP